MPLLRNQRRLGGNLRRNPGLGLSMLDDGGGETYAPVVDPSSLIDDAYIPPPADQPAPNVTTASTPVAMPATTTTAQPLDGRAITAPLSLPDGTVAPVGSMVNDSPNAIVVTYPDGSTRIIYKNAPPPNDPECVRYDTNDLNNGLICQADETRGNLIYIPTERWTGKVQSWGELRANMDTAARLNFKYPDSARRSVWYNNPSWHAQGDVWNYALGLTFAPDFTPTYIGPTTTSGGASMYVVDPDSGKRIDVTDDDAVTPEQAARIEELTYGPVETRAPGQPGYVPPVYSGPPIDETGSIIHDDDAGSVGGGNGTARPPYSGPVSTPNTTVNVAPSSGTPNAALLVGLAAAAFLLLGRRR